MKPGREQLWVVAAGLLLGVLGSLLAYWGNPSNTGICISCFLENTAGALGLHDNARMQYLRPELPAFFLGSFLAAFAAREFRPRTAGAGFAGFGLGALMIVGSVIFIGCPIKALLRLAAGDLTALAGFAGLAAGVWAGLRMLRGPDLKIEGKSRPASPVVAWGLAALVAGAAALLFVPGALRQSASGGGTVHAPVWASLAAGLALGVACQRSRFCVTGAVRDLLLTRRFSVGAGLFAALLGAGAVNALTGQFHLGYADQPGVHLDFAWSFLGMALTGWAAILAGGCPFRQIVKAGEGDLDAASVCAGMVVTAALVQSWGIGGTVEGVPMLGKAATLLGFAALFAFGLVRERTA